MDIKNSDVRRSTAQDSKAPGQHTTANSPRQSGSRHVVHSSKWALGGAVCIKALSSVAQFALAWLLAPADIGMAASAIAIVGITGFVQLGGLHVILVTTKQGFVRVAGQAFYVALLVNILLALMLVCTASTAAEFYGVPLIQPLLWISAATLPIGQFALIESAWLVRTMRFRTLNQINVVQAAIRFGGQIILAFAGFGAYSILFPEIPAAITRVWLVRKLSRRIPLVRPDPRKWFLLWKDAVFLNLNSFLSGLRMHGPILVLGLTFPAATIGLFNWGIMLATQAAHFLAASLANVFLSVFSKYSRDSSRQIDYFVRSTGLLCCILIPVGAVQALLARDFVELLFRNHWAPASPVISATSAGIAFYPILATSQGLMMSQMRYRTLVVLNSIAAVAMFAAAASAFLGATPTNVAVLMVAANAATSMLQAGVAVRFETRTLLGLYKTLGRATLAATPGVAISLAVIHADILATAIARISAVTLINFSCYCVLTRLFVRELHDDFLRCVKLLLQGPSGQRATAATPDSSGNRVNGIAHPPRAAVVQTGN